MHLALVALLRIGAVTTRQDHPFLLTNYYCEQLIRLKQEVERKQPELINKRGVVFHRDNARPQTSLYYTQQKLREFGWEVLMHPPYSPDLQISTCFGLFRIL
ncbi:jg25054 [Pararge aegeria aegeria]|uniref:Jg25054 protein n=1 Tax=Pararge aegeria aegeria TaxID=348720 RepID=A0A8S4R045_9NEOP|nr:jg25054 [Pararge aegeria aegeria]